MEARRPRIRVAIALLHEGKLLLVQHTKGDRSYWLLPGGGLEWGEEVREAGRREVEEETGILAEVGQLALVSETVAPDESRHLLHLVFAARYLGGEPTVPPEDRITDVRWMPLDQVADLVMHPPIQSVLCELPVERLTFSAEDGIFLGNLWVD